MIGLANATLVAPVVPLADAVVPLAASGLLIWALAVGLALVILAASLNRRRGFLVELLRSFVDRNQPGGPRPKESDPPTTPAEPSDADSD